ncbi:MAG: phosphoribosylanthranilate isomerase [Oscillospiraceae bacterium]|nr:phosphoribosylanthranilate isomerase [Oscillospiraceae bacterium]MBR7084938.1 phosphoribosylanthranilate isomerase [Oscillospiraceae bacterium]
MNTLIKICGIRRLEDIEILNQYPPDYAGFICSKPFWRYVSPEQLEIFHQNLNKHIRRVGVFVNPTIEEISKYADWLDIIQLHGEESENFIQQIKENFWSVQIWKAVRIRTPKDIQKADKLPVDKLVLDSFSEASHGGTGTLAPWDIIKENRPQKPFFLAGGISAENISEAIQSVQPFGIDVSSSVETDKHKDIDKIKQIIQIIRN